MSPMGRPPLWLLVSFCLGILVSAALAVWGYMSIVPRGGLTGLAWTGWMALIAVLNAYLLLRFLSR